MNTVLEFLIYVLMAACGCWLISFYPLMYRGFWAQAYLMLWGLFAGLLAEYLIWQGFDLPALHIIFVVGSCAFVLGLSGVIDPDRTKRVEVNDA